MNQAEKCRAGKPLSRLFAMGLAVALMLGVAEQAAAVTPMVSTGQFATVALKSDGTVLAWGMNTAGQVGDGTTTDRNSPVKVSSLTDVIAVSTGHSHVLALKSDGTVWAWGSNDYGQLAAASSTTRSTTPIQVSGLSNVIAVAAGAAHSYALKKDGTVWAWGDNYGGKLGTGNTNPSTTPVQVINLTDVAGISAGGNHGMALKSDGSIWMWGVGDKGQLGDGASVNRSTPVMVSGLPTITAISAGYDHNLAVSSDGKVYAWGANDTSQLGDGTKTGQNRGIPGLVKMLDSTAKLVDMSNITAVSAGRGGSVALDKTGKVYQWGTLPPASNDKSVQSMTAGIDFDFFGILYSKTVKMSSRVSQVSAGLMYALYLNSDGSVYSAGYNDGRLGTGNTSATEIPVEVLGENGQGKLNLGSQRTAMSVSGTASGDKKSLTLPVKLKIDSDDRGMDGKIYVAAKIGDSFFLNNGKSWEPYTGGAFPVYATGTLGDKDITAFSKLDTTGLTGVTIIIGYGTSESDMLNNKKYRTVYTIQ